MLWCCDNLSLQRVIVGFGLGSIFFIQFHFKDCFLFPLLVNFKVLKLPKTVPFSIWFIFNWITVGLCLKKLIFSVALVVNFKVLAIVILLHWIWYWNYLKLCYFLFKFIELNHLWIMSKQTNIFITNPDFTGATDNNIPESNQGMD